MKRSKGKVRDRESRVGWAFLIPSFTGVLIFILIPFMDVVRRSFTEAMNSTFVGMNNYKNVISNGAFKQAVGNTGRFLATCIPLLLVLSLLLALLLSSYSGKTGRGEFFKTSFLIPMAIPVASVVFLWKVIFDEKGLLNVFIVKAGGGVPIDFINTDMAFYLLVFSYIWRNLGYDMVLWLAGLNGISASLYEAAAVDGAGKLKKFWYITLPELKPVFFVTAVLSLINSFKVFREAYLIAGDYPHTSIYMLQHLFNNWFVSMDIQKMSAAAVLTAIAILLIICVTALVAGRGGEKDEE